MTWLSFTIPVGLLILGSLACAGIHGYRPLETIRQTFMPRSAREFWLPPCPLCWAVRAVLVVALFAAGNQLLAA